MNLSAGESTKPVFGVADSASVSVSDHCVNCQNQRKPLCLLLRSKNGLNAFPLKVREYEHEATIFEDSEIPGLIGVIKSGYLRAERIDGNGGRTVVGIFHPGEIVGCLPGRKSEVTIAAATDVEICQFEKKAVMSLIDESPRFRSLFLSQVIRIRDRLLDMIWQRGLLKSHERVIGFLVMMAGIMPIEPLPDGSTIVSIALSRHDWADMSNTTEETVSRTMTDLLKKGLVESVERNRYRIRNLDQLAKIVGIKAAKASR